MWKTQEVREPDKGQFCLGFVAREYLLCRPCFSPHLQPEACEASCSFLTQTDKRHWDQHTGHCTPPWRWKTSQCCPRLPTPPDRLSTHSKPDHCKTNDQCQIWCLTVIDGEVQKSCFQSLTVWFWCAISQWTKRHTLWTSSCYLVLLISCISSSDSLLKMLILKINCKTKGGSGVWDHGKSRPVITQI